MASKQTDLSTAGYWYKLATLNVTYQYGSGALRASIFTEGDGSNECGCSVIIQCRVKQQAAMGEKPMYGIHLIANDGFTADQFRICITENTTSLTSAEIWVKIVKSYQYHDINIDRILPNEEINTSMTL